MAVKQLGDDAVAAGDLLMDAPEHESFEHLVELAHDKKAWILAEEEPDSGGGMPTPLPRGECAKSGRRALHTRQGALRRQRK